MKKILSPPRPLLAIIAGPLLALALFIAAGWIFGANSDGIARAGPLDVQSTFNDAGSLVLLPAHQGVDQVTSDANTTDYMFDGAARDGPRDVFLSTLTDVTDPITDSGGFALDSGVDTIYGLPDRAGAATTTLADYARAGPSPFTASIPSYAILFGFLVLLGAIVVPRVRSRNFTEPNDDDTGDDNDDGSSGNYFGRSRHLGLMTGRVAKAQIFSFAALEFLSRPTAASSVMTGVFSQLQTIKNFPETFLRPKGFGRGERRNGIDYRLQRHLTFA